MCIRDRPDKDTFLRDMNALGLPGIEVTAEPSVKCGVTGTHVHVFVHGEEEGHEHHDHEHEHGHEHHHKMCIRDRLTVWHGMPCCAASCAKCSVRRCAPSDRARSASRSGAE